MSNSLYEIFENKKGRVIHKWIYAFDIYERYLAPWKNKKVTLLEIGVQNGGSLEMWREYLGPDSTILGIDINSKCQEATNVEENIHVKIGNANNTQFLTEVVEQFGTIDIVIDDGSHADSDIKAAFDFLYPKLSADGFYLIEDIGSNGGGANVLHQYNHKVFNAIKDTIAASATCSVGFYPSVLVCERGTVNYTHKRHGDQTPVG